MPPISSARKSAKITDVLQILYNPRTPEAAKQRTLRRLDGLEGRHAPIPKRKSLENHDRGREGQRTSSDLETESSTTRSSSVGANSSSSSCRLSITEGVAPLSSTDLERRLPSPPSVKPPVAGRRRVVFMDQWEFEGQEHGIALQESLRIGAESERTQN